MKKLTLVVRILAACLLLLASGRVLIAQQPPSGNGAKHHKYKFADLGTFGGPDSIIPFGQRIVTEHGTVVGISETDMPDPFAPNCSLVPIAKYKTALSGAMVVWIAWKCQMATVVTQEPLSHAAESLV